MLNCSSDDKAIGTTISKITIIRLLEGTWLLTLCHEGRNSQLLVFNTLPPQQDSRSWRILGLPPLPAPQYCTQYENAPTEPPEFSVDPAQRLFVVIPLDKRALATPVALLIRRIHSVHASPYIPGDEWVEDFTEIKLHPTEHTLRLFDTKVLVPCGSERYPKDWGVQMFDLSKSDQRDIQVRQVSEGAGGVCRRVLSAPKWFARCRMGDGTPHSTLFVGNKVICFFVSPPHVQSPRGLFNSASTVKSRQTVFPTRLDTRSDVSSGERTQGSSCETTRSARPTHHSSRESRKVQGTHQ